MLFIFIINVNPHFSDAWWFPSLPNVDNSRLQVHFVIEHFFYLCIHFFSNEYFFTLTYIYNKFAFKILLMVYYFNEIRAIGWKLRQLMILDTSTWYKSDKIYTLIIYCFLSRPTRYVFFFHLPSITFRLLIDIIFMTSRFDKLKVHFIRITFWIFENCVIFKSNIKHVGI